MIKSQVGDRYVIQEMLKSEASLGGEPSGHIIFLDHNTTGDGLVSALQVLRIMIETGSKLSELAACFKRYPQITVNVRVASKPDLKKVRKLQDTIQLIETALHGAGRVLCAILRTENICRVMVEGPKRSETQKFAQELANIIKKEIGV